MIKNIEYEIVISNDVYKNTDLSSYDIEKYFNNINNIFKLKFDNFNYIEINSNDVSVLPFVSINNKLILSINL